MDALVDKVISAQTRPELVARLRALDRVLRLGHYVVPHWYSGVHRVGVPGRALRATHGDAALLPARELDHQHLVGTEANRDELRRSSAGQTKN